MKKWKKRLLITFAVILVGVASTFVFLHDDSDLEAIEKEQLKSIDEATSEDKFDAIGDDLENFDTIQDSL
jgi:hypothetical protein